MTEKQKLRLMKRFYKKYARNYTKDPNWVLALMDCYYMGLEDCDKLKKRTKKV